MYKFDAQHAVGSSGEETLDGYFRSLGWLTVTAVPMHMQRRGIDRRFLDARDMRVVYVEYKTDFAAARTGNAFVETVSVDRGNKAGWAFSSQADLLVYYIPGDELVYLIRFNVLRHHLSRWLRTYPTRDVPNDGYVTRGLLVPLREFEAIAQEVLSL